jgi:hypothetical protein
VTFYKSIPVVVEAYRFDGNGASTMHILDWLAEHGIKNAIWHVPDSNGPPQLDLLITHVKVADLGDYIVRLTEVEDEPRHKFKVMTESHFKATYENSKGP